MIVLQVFNMLSFFCLVEYIYVFEKEFIDGVMLSFFNLEGFVQFGVINVLYAFKIFGYVVKLKCDY